MSPRRGRPLKRAYRADERVPLSLRVTPNFWRYIGQKAKANGRSVSAELELRLEIAALLERVEAVGLSAFHAYLDYDPKHDYGATS